jgi:hypothetical protein
VYTKNDEHPSASAQMSRHTVAASMSSEECTAMPNPWPSGAGSTRTPLLPVVEPYFHGAAAVAGSVEAASAAHATDSRSSKSSSKIHCVHIVAQRRYIAVAGGVVVPARRQYRLPPSRPGCTSYRPSTSMPFALPAANPGDATKKAVVKHACESV